MFSGSEPTFYLCGDSTMADYPPDQSPMTGWGQALQALTGLDVRDNPYRPSSVSEKDAVLCREAAHQACLHPCEVTPMN